MLNIKNLKRPNDLDKEQRGHSSRLSCDKPKGSRGQSHITAASTGLKRRSFQQDAAEGLRQCYKWNQPQGTFGNPTEMSFIIHNFMKVIAFSSPNNLESQSFLNLDTHIQHFYACTYDWENPQSDLSVSQWCGRIISYPSIDHGKEGRVWR